MPNVMNNRKRTSADKLRRFNKADWEEWYEEIRKLYIRKRWLGRIVSDHNKVGEMVGLWTLEDVKEFKKKLDERVRKRKERLLQKGD